jgi:hypothetical protein
VTLREVCIDQVVVALAHEVPDATPEAIGERAESLVYIAEHYGVPVQPVLLQWVHYRHPGKLWSGEEWTRYCVKYSETKISLASNFGVDYVEQLEVLNEMPEAQPRMLCTRCYANEALQLGSGRWFCPHCGDVT